MTIDLNIVAACLMSLTEKFEVNSQHAKSLHASEHASSHRLEVIGRQVKLHHRGGTFERSILNLWDLVVTQVTERKEDQTRNNKP